MSTNANDVAPPSPEATDVPVSLRLTRSQHETARKVAHMEQRTTSQQLRYWIQSGIEAWREEQAA